VKEHSSITASALPAVVEDAAVGGLVMHAVLLMAAEERT
jgi:hypothetical protein